MLTHETINVNNPIQADNRNFCELATQCAICALTARIATAVVDFFSYIVIKIYEYLVTFCEGFDRLITFQNCDYAEEEDTAPFSSSPPTSFVIQSGDNSPDTDQSNFRQESEYNIHQILRNDDMGNLFQGLFRNIRLQEREEVVVDYGHLDEEAPSIPTETVKEKTPTAAEAQERRKAALERLKQISASEFECPASIMDFDLDNALEKYRSDKSPDEFLGWYDYAMCDKSKKTAFKQILDKLKIHEENKKYQAVRNLVSKVQYILTEKRARVDKLPQSEKPDAEKALKQEIRYIISRLLNADADCIDQTLTQLEGIAIEVIATENPLGKNSAVSLLQYKASHALFEHRANLIKEILVADPVLEDPVVTQHMADIEREVKKALAGAVGIKGNILEVGAQFGAMVERQAQEAAERAGPIFYEKYEPVEYLQEQNRLVWSNTRRLRTDLLSWATTYYGLDGEDELSKAVVKSQEDLENLCTIAAVELTLPGIQLFLEAAGIIQQRKG